MTQLVAPSETGPQPDNAATESGSIGGQGLRFTLVGTAGTLLQLGMYAVTAPFLGAQFASVASWLVSTLATNATHRAVTFRVRGAARNRSDQIAAFVTCLVGLLITSVVLDSISDATGTSGVIAILAVNTAVGVVRFAGMRWWLSPAGRRAGVQISVTVDHVKTYWHAHHSPSRVNGLPR